MQFVEPGWQTSSGSIEEDENCKPAVDPPGSTGQVVSICKNLFYGHLCTVTKCMCRGTLTACGNQDK